MTSRIHPARRQPATALRERDGGDGAVERANEIGTDALLEDGIFGDASERLRARLGNLVVLPHAHEMVWWKADGRFELRKSGHHGGLTPDEAEIPLLAYAA